MPSPGVRLSCGAAAAEPTTGAPSPVEDKQLRDLHIRVVVEE